MPEDNSTIPTRRRRRGPPVSLRGPKFTIKSAEVQEKRLQALQLRKAGASYPMIAKQMGLSTPMVAWRYVQDALAEIPVEAAAELKSIMLIGIDADLVLLNNLHAKARTVAGHAKLVLAKIRLRELHARLLGLNAPTRNEHTGKDGVPLTLTMNEIQGMTDEQLDRTFAASRRSGPSGSGAGASASPPRSPRDPH